ncbi:hypothetical protein [Halobacillus litoralis]|uniref:hypothetical protein n=1 Tax=Halobacillus litoralis TaxID=45668 RepID=UPI001CFDE620|nr:hypothetical protein [Halobacillus litoralis]
MVHKSIAQVETIVDHNIESLKIYEKDKNDIILFLCQLFEWRVRNIKKINNMISEIVPVEFAQFGVNANISSREKIMDEHEALSLLVREVIKNNKSQEKIKNVDKTVFHFTNEAFSRALEQIRAESLFTSMYHGLFDCEVLSVRSGNECIKFSYKSSEIACYEAVNAFILEDFNNVKRINYESPEKLGIKNLSPWTFIKIRQNADKWMDVEFQLPNDFQVGPYTIRQIKEVWAYVITKAYLEYYSNVKRKFPTLMELNYQDWRFKYSSKEMAETLINDLTYNGYRNKTNVNGKPIYTTLLTEPILEINNKKLISPTLILNYQASRNILSTLNRIYEGHPKFDPSMHSDRKEEIFTKELIDNFKKFPNLKFSNSIGLTQPEKTDVDFIIYDMDSMSLICFELKWLNEPVTAVEIKNKDEELEKGINVQLPNYEKGVSHDLNKFMLKAFKKEYDVKEISYFVLTKGTIGSGKISRENYHIINQRMLEKALSDSQGDLQSAIEKLKNHKYLPKQGKHFELVSDIETKVGNVTMLSDGYSVLSPYSLNY